MRGGPCPHCGQFIHAPVRAKLQPILAGVALAIALLLPGCAQGVELEGGISDWLARGVHVSWSISTVTVPEIHYPRAGKIEGPE